MVKLVLILLLGEHIGSNIVNSNLEIFSIIKRYSLPYGLIISLLVIHFIWEFEELSNVYLLNMRKNYTKQASVKRNG